MDRDNDSALRYIREASKHPPLSIDEERRLIREAKKNLSPAINKLILSHLNLVIHIAQKYKTKNLSLADLISEGILGLITAISKFSMKKNVRLATYASRWIKYQINNAVLKEGIFKTPVKIRQISRQLRKRYSSIVETYGPNPNLEELAKFLKVKKEDLKEALLYDQVSRVEELPLDYLKEKQNDWAALVSSSPIEIYKKKRLREEIKKSFGVLTKREREVIERFFGLGWKHPHPMSLSEIGKELGVSRERVRQIKEVGCKKLKAELKRRWTKILFGE